jgi:hypothetical protein
MLELPSVLLVSTVASRVTSLPLLGCCVLILLVLLCSCYEYRLDPIHIPRVLIVKTPFEWKTVESFTEVGQLDGLTNIVFTYSTYEDGGSDPLGEFPSDSKSCISLMYVPISSPIRVSS